jgi:hypothetical protein
MLLSTMTSGVSLRQSPHVVQPLIHEQEPLGGQVLLTSGLLFRPKELHMGQRPLIVR